MKGYNNPWLGLQSYQEGDRLYGRDEEIEDLSMRIESNVQTIIYGGSGVGKTSIMRAGILPKLRENNILPVYIRLVHNEQPYIEQIKDCLFEQLAFTSCSAIEIVKKPIVQDDYYGNSLWEFFHRYEFRSQEGTKVSPMLVFDQFDEIFLLQKYKREVDNFFLQLADLLNNSKPAYLTECEEFSYVKDSIKKDFRGTGFTYKEEVNFHIVIIIREEYLSHIERYSTNIPLLRNNRCCLEPINEEQAAKIIMQPCPGLVDKAIARRIIEKVALRTDFELDGIPDISVNVTILSFYLSRLYYDTKGGESKITPALIEQSGNVIKNFYEVVIAQYPQSVIEFLEDNLISYLGHRESISLDDATHSCSELTEAVLQGLTSDRLIRQFVYHGTIYIEFMNDILCPVVVERKKYRFKQQSDAIKVNDNINLWNKIQQLFQDSNALETQRLIDTYKPHKVEYDIFISYRRIDGRDCGRNIQQALKGRGYKQVFFDYDSIQKGEFTKRIIDAIYSCSDFIILLSPKSMKRCTRTGDPVANEIRTAVRYHKNIIPVTIDGREVKWPRNFPDDLQFITGLQFHDHKSDSYFEDSIDKLCSKLTCK